MNDSAKPQPPSHVVLDSRSLGRPVHLLPEFALKLRELLNDALRELLNRRYRASYQAGEIRVDSVNPVLPGGAWVSTDIGQGRICCQLDRALVLGVMSLRYGPLPSDAAPPETATETRLAGQLAWQFLQALVGGFTRLAAQADPATAAPADVPPVRGALPPGEGAWLISVPVDQNPDSPIRLQEPGRLLFAIDAQWIGRLLRAQSRQRGKPGTPLPEARELAGRLQLKLVARLLQTELGLGDLLDLQPGSIIPVRMQATEVLIDGSRLFNASVAEHKGKLCLTSLEDIR
jgi:flagellar motor switch protein FliM